MKKTIILLLTVALLFAVGSFAYAQEDNEWTIDEAVEASDLEVSEPTLLPDSPLYFLKNWQRGITSFFTFSKTAKAELKLKHASERLLEAKKLAEKTDEVDIIDKAVENYEREINSIKDIAEEIEDKAEENIKVGKFLDKFIQQQILHQKVIDKIEEKVPEQAMERIREMREIHVQRFGEVMEKLETKENLRQRIENNLEEIEGSEFKDFKNMELLKRFEEKASEEVKEKIQEVREKTLERFREKLETLPEETQERLENYIENIKGETESKMEILEDVKSRLRNSNIINKLDVSGQRIINEVREKIEGIECPAYTTTCTGNARRVVTRDENGCPVVRCVTPTNVAEIRTKCITLWDPVCGTDGKTYSNSCLLREAGIDIAHKGACE